MILNGLGFSNRPLSLTPQFFENKPLEVLFGPEVKASDFNHYKLGRGLDDAVGYGSELLFSELAITICRSEGVDCISISHEEGDVHCLINGLNDIRKKNINSIWTNRIRDISNFF